MNYIERITLHFAAFDLRHFFFAKNVPKLVNFQNLQSAPVEWKIYSLPQNPKDFNTKSKGRLGLRQAQPARISVVELVEDHIPQINVDKVPMFKNQRSYVDKFSWYVDR